MQLSTWQDMIRQLLTDQLFMFAELNNSLPTQSNNNVKGEMSYQSRQKFDVNFVSRSSSLSR